MATVLVTGGAGYIGSHTIIELLENGYDVISVDNFINSTAESYLQINRVCKKDFNYYSIDLCHKHELQTIFENNSITGVIHFAALKAVGESVEQPSKYYRNNITGMLNLLDLCLEHQVKQFIFSSSCSVYGNVSELPVTESTSMDEAQSPYAYTKQVGERLLSDILGGTNVSSISLRYFNPAGAHQSGEIGESPINTAQNLIPVITEFAANKRTSLIIYGNDYDTRDGTCVRDYIHVVDLAKAHVLALQFLEKSVPGSSEVINLGIGDGVTVMEAIKAFESIAGIKINYEMGPRREGDVVSIYADNTKAKKLLGWEPQFGINDIMSTAWKWEQKRNE
jgi:UDP-glucose 4-epimerase